MKCKFDIAKTNLGWRNYTTQLKGRCNSTLTYICPPKCPTTTCPSPDPCTAKCYSDFFKDTLTNLQSFLQHNKTKEPCGKYETSFEDCEMKECPKKQSGTFFIRRMGIGCYKLKTQLPNDVVVTTECYGCSSSPCCSSPVFCRLTLKEKIQNNSTATSGPTSSSASSSAEMTTDFSIKSAAAFSKDKTDSGAVTGGAIGGVGFVAVIAMILLYIFYFRRKSSRKEKEPSTSPSFSNTTYNQPQGGVAFGVLDTSANRVDSFLTNTGYQESGGEHYCSLQPEQKEKYDYDYVVQSPPSKQIEFSPDAVTTNYEFAEPFQQDSNKNYFVLDPQNESASPVNAAGDADKNYFTLEPDTQPIVNTAGDNYFILENNGRNVDSLDNKERDGDDMYNTLNEGNKGTRDTGGDEYHHLRDVIKHGDEKDLDDYDELHESKNRSHNEIDDDYDHCKPRRDDKFEDDYDHLG